MKIALNDLQGSALDYAVSKAAGYTTGYLEGYPDSLCVASNGRCIGILTGADIKSVFEYGYFDPHKTGKLVDR